LEPLGHNKLCELEDFDDATFRRYAAEIFAGKGGRISFDAARPHRKVWEVAQAARTLVDFGAIHPDAEILGVAAGVEETTFWATKYARRVFATDLYLDAGGWVADAPRSMLVAPEEHAPCAWNERRLVVQHMNALELHYDDRSFDGAYCTSSLEHFGDEGEMRQALSELWRVVKPGGIVTLTTEFRLRGPPPGLPGTRIFDAAELEALIVQPLAWELVEPLDANISDQTLATEMLLADAHPGPAARFPHIVLREGELLFTSVHLALRKIRP
jgi:ubiquinone/menaquinone biosynthesis C-methylase UbiE